MCHATNIIVEMDLYFHVPTKQALTIQKKPQKTAVNGQIIEIHQKYLLYNVTSSDRKMCPSHRKYLNVRYWSEAIASHFSFLCFKSDKVSVPTVRWLSIITFDCYRSPIDSQYIDWSRSGYIPLQRLIITLGLLKIGNSLGHHPSSPVNFNDLEF